MCGLVGAASSFLTKQEKDIFVDLLFVSAMRGWDSAGVAAITEAKGKYDWHVSKRLGPSMNLLASEEFRKIISFGGTKALIGHTRSATIGEVRIENAHPFEFDFVVGAHNGTLTGSYPGKEIFATDSEAIYNLIDEHGAEKAIPQFYGAYALTWFDKFKTTLNFLRNNQRDLFYAYTHNLQTLFWASEKGMLQFVLNRRGIKDYDIFKFKEDHLITFALNENFFFERPGIVEVKGAAFATYKGGEVRGPFDHTYWKGLWDPETGEIEPSKSSSETITPAPALLPKPTENPTTTSISNSKSMTCSETSTVEDSTTDNKPSQEEPACYRGFRGMMLKHSHIRMLLRRGCLWCNHEMALSDPIRWVNRTQYACRDCKDSPVLMFSHKEELKKEVA